MLLAVGGVTAPQLQDLLGEGLALGLQVAVEALEEIAFDQGLLEVFLSLLQVLPQPVRFLDDAFEFFLVDFEELVGLELHDALLEFAVLLLEFADGFLQVFGAGQVDFSRRFGVIGRLRVGQEGLLRPEVVQPRLDLLRPRRFVACRTPEFLENLVFALLCHFINYEWPLRL